MVVVVDVSVEGAERPPPGTPLIVQVRDVSVADAAAEVVATTEATVRGQQGRWLETVELDVPRRPTQSTVWVHVDVDGDGRVSVGDFITMASFPVPAGDEVRVPVTVRKV